MSYRRSIELIGKLSVFRLIGATIVAVGCAGGASTESNELGLEQSQSTSYLDTTINSESYSFEVVGDSSLCVSLITAKSKVSSSCIALIGWSKEQGLEHRGIFLQDRPLQRVKLVTLGKGISAVALLDFKYRVELHALHQGDGQGLRFIGDNGVVEGHRGVLRGEMQYVMATSTGRVILHSGPQVLGDEEYRIVYAYGGDSLGFFQLASDTMWRASMTDSTFYLLDDARYEQFYRQALSLVPGSR